MARAMEITTPLGKDVLLFNHMSAREELGRLSEFEIDDSRIDFIFPYRIPDYVQYRYVRTWYFRFVPRSLFRKLERLAGWHLCITARTSHS